MKADLFDFDKTVFPTDSGISFWGFCIKKRPYILVCLPYQAFCTICYALGIGHRTWAKAGLLCFFRMIDAPAMCDEFWKKNLDKIYPFFRPENRERPAVVCSASPEFFLRPACEAMKVEHLIATKTDPKTGRHVGTNCHDTEKVARIRKELPDVEFICAYSDSKSDLPMLGLAQKRFLLKKGEMTQIK